MVRSINENGEKSYGKTTAPENDARLGIGHNVTLGRIPQGVLGEYAHA